MAPLMEFIEGADAKLYTEVAINRTNTVVAINHLANRQGICKPQR